VAFTPKEEKGEDKDGEKETAKKRWLVECRSNNRGSNLLASTPASTDKLESHPLAVLARPLSQLEQQRATENVERQSDGRAPALLRERAALLWPGCVQLWTIADGAVRKDCEWRNAAESARCIIHLDWAVVPTAGAAAGGGGVRGGGAGGGGAGTSAEAGEAALRFWMIGTADDEVHLLRSDDLHPTSGGGVRLDIKVRSAEDPDEQPSQDDRVRASTPIGITSLAVIAPGTGDRGMTKQSLDRHPKTPSAMQGQSTLCVGFEDGSVRQYELEPLMRDLLGGSSTRPL
jgi:hypothetical protein